MVSIIMAAYNAEATIDDSIRSVIAQTCRDWELIVIDDASADGTVNIVQEFENNDRRIKLIKNAKNEGVAAARNTGAGHAKGEWLAYIDSDDLWLGRKLEDQLRFGEEKGAVITYTATSYIDPSGRASSYVLPAKPELTYKELLRRNIMSCSSVMVRREHMAAFPHGNLHEDYAVWLRIVKKAGRAYGLDEPLLIYRMGGSTKSSNRINSAKMNRGAYREAGYGGIVSTLYMLRYAAHSISKRAMVRKGMKNYKKDVI